MPTCNADSQRMFFAQICRHATLLNRFQKLPTRCSTANIAKNSPQRAVTLEWFFVQHHIIASWRCKLTSVTSPSAYSKWFWRVGYLLGGVQAEWVSRLSASGGHENVKGFLERKMIEDFEEAAQWATDCLVCSVDHWLFSMFCFSHFKFQAWQDKTIVQFNCGWFWVTLHAG